MSWHVAYELGTKCGERKGCSQARQVAHLVGCLCGKHKPLSVFNPWCTGNSTSWGEWRGRRVRYSKLSSATESLSLTWVRDAVLLVCQAVYENLLNTAVHMHLIRIHSPFLPPFAHRSSLCRFSFCAKEQCKRGLEKGNICIWGGAGQPASTGVISFVLEWWMVVPFIIQFVYISEAGEQYPFPSEPQAHCIDQ